MEPLEKLLKKFETIKEIYEYSKKNDAPLNISILRVGNNGISVLEEKKIMR